MNYCHSKSVSVVLYLLLFILPLAALASAHVAVSQWVLGAQVLSGVLVLASLCCGVAAAIGWPLRRFIGAQVKIAESAMTVTTHRGERIYPWENIGKFHDHKILQLLCVYDRQGQLILVVDHFLVKYSEFKLKLDEKISAQTCRS